MSFMATGYDSVSGSILTHNGVVNAGPTVNGTDVGFEIGGDEKERASVAGNKEFGEFDAEQPGCSCSVLPGEKRFLLHRCSWVQRYGNIPDFRGPLAYDDNTLNISGLVQGVGSLDESLPVPARGASQLNDLGLGHDL